MWNPIPPTHQDYLGICCSTFLCHYHSTLLKWYRLPCNRALPILCKGENNDVFFIFKKRKKPVTITFTRIPLFGILFFFLKFCLPLSKFALMVLQRRSFVAICFCSIFAFKDDYIDHWSLLVASDDIFDVTEWKYLYCMFKTWSCNHFVKIVLFYKVIRLQHFKRHNNINEKNRLMFKETGGHLFTVS